MIKWMMINKYRNIVLIALLFVMAGWMNGADRDFGFGAMEIFEFSNLTTNLVVTDIDNDGRDDILFLDNRASRLEILVRKRVEDPGEGLPTLEERFTNKGFVLDNWVKRFKVADMNNDGGMDIVTMDNRQGLQIHFREEAGTYRKPISLNLKDASKLKGFRIADLDLDKRPDILVYRQEDAEILWNDTDGTFKTRLTLDFSAYGCRAALVSDVNGDGFPDLLFVFPKETLPLRFRPGKGGKRFGWEQSLPLPDIRSIEIVRQMDDKTPKLGMILKNGLILRLYDFESKPGSELFSEGEAFPRRLPLKGISRRSAPAWVSADMDKDGYDDFCTAAPLLSQVHLYRGGPEGLDFSPVTIDSLRDIRTMALTGQGDVVVFSEAEKAIALHSNQNIKAFPRYLKAPGEPSAVAAAGDTTIFGLFKDVSKDQFDLHLFNAEKQDGKPFESFSTDLTDTPLEMKAFPLNGNDHFAIMFFMPYDKPVMLRLYKGKLKTVTAEQFRALGSTLKPGEVTAVGQAGAPVLLVTEGNVARLYRWQDERFVVSGQLNPRTEAARLGAGCRVDNNGKKFLLYNDADQELYCFSPENSTEAAHVRVKDGLKSLVGLTTLKLKDRRGVLLVGESEIQWLPQGEPSLQLTKRSEYVSESEKPSLWNFYPVTLGSPAQPKLVLLDANNRSMEVVSLDKTGKLVEELVFEVFQDPGFNNPVSDTMYEPHDLESGNFNGDQIRDMVVLVHDKLLIYLGE